MSTVAISTCDKKFLLTNYGSFFQHYALRRVLTSFGYQTFRVHPQDERSSYIDFVWDFLTDCIRPFWWLVKRLPNREFYRKKNHARNCAHWLFRRDFDRLIANFDEAQPFGDETIGVVGGDQVLYQRGDREWLCDVGGERPLITYAASACWSSVANSPEWRDALARRLSRFSAVGVREQCGVEVVRSLVRNRTDVCHVADPVQLLTAEEWRIILPKRPYFKERVLFCYLLNIHNKEALDVLKYEQLAKMLGCKLKILGIQDTECFIPARYQTTMSPLEFLRALNDAEYFVTNSYHGSVFALIMHKNFLSLKQVLLPERNENSRQQELMSMFNLQSYWIDPNVQADEMKSRLSQDIDWAQVDSRLNRFRRESMNWLRGSLAMRRI